MALQVWLPLNKDFRNQGLRAGITVTNNGTTFVENGSNVFNGCYHHTASQNFSINGLDYSKLNAATVALWAYYDAARNSLFFTGPTTSYYLMATSNGTGGLYNGNAGSPTFYVDGVKTNTPGAAGGWHHYCVTNTNLSSWSGAFKFNNYGSGWNYAGKVADIRIYDHVLTEEEVKELYWCKIFDLDAYDNFPGVNNLISQPSNGGLIPPTYGWAPEKHVNAIYPNNSWSSGYNSGVGSPSSGYHACWKIIENTPTIVFQDMNSTIGQTHRWLGVSNWGTAGKVSPSQKYTISMEARADVDGKQISSGLYYKRVSSESSNFYDGCTTKTVTKEWKRYYWHYTSASAVDATTGYVYIYGHYGTEGVSYVRNIQFEIGHVENDFAYTSRPALAYNGNGTDGVFDSISVVDSASTLYFDGTNSYIKTTDLDFMKIVDTGYTFSLWINSQEADSSRSIYFGCGDQGNGWTFALEKQASTNKFRVYNNGSPDWYVDNCVISPNQWIHVAVTRSGGTVTVYKNGVSVGTKTGFSNHSAFDKIYYVGSDYRTGDTRYKGYIGGFKIYANPLTAADVSTLYNKEKKQYS